MDTQTPTSSAPEGNNVSQPKKPWLWMAIVFSSIIVVGAIIAAVIMAQNNDTPSEQAVQRAQEVGQVSISANGLNPATITVKKGQSVTWTNEDTQTHSVVSTEGPQSVIDSEEPLNPGDTYSVTFSETGTYNYNDGTGSAAFAGTVIVE